MKLIADIIAGSLVLAFFGFFGYWFFVAEPVLGVVFVIFPAILLAVVWAFSYLGDRLEDLL